MIITKKLLALAVLVVLIGISSCNDDDGPNQLTKDEAKAKIASFNSTASGDISGVADADGVKAVQDFFNLVDTDDPFGRIGTDKKKVRAFFHDKGQEFKSIFVTKASGGRTASDEPFDFEGNSGIYVWNPEIGEAGGFEKISAAEIIIVRFPTDGSETNNAELRLTAYSEVEFFDEEFQEYSYEPASLTATISVDGVEVASLDLEINWTDDGFPRSASVTLGVAPYSAAISFDDGSPTSSTLSVSFKKNQEVLVATTVTARYSSSNKSEDDLESLDGFVQFRNLSIEGSVNIEAANQAEVDWNAIIDADLLIDGQKLGDIVFVEENDEPVPYLVYADGTQEKLEAVLQPVIDEIEQLTEDLRNDE
jgi:hypothetical protein